MRKQTLGGVLILAALIFGRQSKGYIYDIAEVLPLPNQRNFTATSINNSGVVAGFSFTGSQNFPSVSGPPYSSAVAYTQKENFLDDKKSSTLLGINNAGAAAGTELIDFGGYAGIPFAIRWDAGGQTRTGLNPLGVENATQYGTQAVDINDAGTVAGYSIFRSSTLGSGRKAVIWPSGSSEPMDLGLSALSEVKKINNAGQLIGIDAGQPFFYSGARVDIPSPAGGAVSTATALNDKGTVVGNYGGAKAYIWNQSTGVKRLDDTFTGINGFTPADINNDDIAVGTWVGGVRGSLKMGFSRLADRVKPGTGWDLSFSTPVAINELGQIVGTATLNGVSKKTFVLTPRVTKEQIVGSLSFQLGSVSRERNVAPNPEVAGRESLLIGLFGNELNVTMKEAAEVMGFDHFNFISDIIHIPDHWTLTDGINGVLHTPFHDPIDTRDGATGLQGFDTTTQKPITVAYKGFSADKRPFYYNEKTGGNWDVKEFVSKDGFSLRFQDEPSSPDIYLQPGDYTRFETRLVGVYADGTWDDLPLPRIRWSNNARHNSNGQVLGEKILLSTVPSADLPSVIDGGIFDIEVVSVPEPSSYQAAVACILMLLGMRTKRHDGTGQYLAWVFLRTLAAS